MFYNVNPCTSQFNYIEMGCKGFIFTQGCYLDGIKKILLSKNKEPDQMLSDPSLHSSLFVLKHPLFRIRMAKRDIVTFAWAKP